MGSQNNLRIAALLLAAMLAAVAAQSSTVSVYLPGYREADWNSLRGSVISVARSATAYTIFCAEEPPACELQNDIPFIFAEGPKTLLYQGIAGGLITVDMECILEGTTKAACTGSTSLGTSYRNGPLSGPTQTIWTSTFTGSQVTWAALTLATPGPLPTTRPPWLEDDQVSATDAPSQSSTAAGQPSLSRLTLTLAVALVLAWTVVA